MTDFTATRAAFHLLDGITYLDGNSLGPLPRGVSERVARTISEEWGDELIRAWGSRGWMALPDRLGDRIAPLIGAAPGSVTLGDTLSIKLFQVLSAALKMRPDRRIIVSDSGNFPSDLYVADELARSLDRGHDLRMVPPDEVSAHLDDDVAVLMLTEVDYRTGRRHDLRALTEAAHEKGIVTVWDLAHSAGAFPVELSASGTEFAVGCTYKYLNSGPGGPAFVYVRPDLSETVAPALAGWLGHAAPFAFEPTYRPAAGAQRLRVGTPPILQMAALDAALDVWEGVDLEALHTRSMELSERFRHGVARHCPGLALASPADPAARGSQISFRHPDAATVMEALIARGVIGDFRAPDILRFGITPLYIGEDDVDRAVAVLTEIANATSGRPSPETPERRPAEHRSSR